MHGRKRSEYKAKFADPKVSAALEQKAQQWNQLSQMLLQQRQSFSSDNEKDSHGTLQLTTKLLTVNPDPSWMWNMRRDLLLLTSSPVKQFPVTPELDLTATCLQRNPKAYGAWFHRKWVVQQLCTRTEPMNNANDVSEQDVVSPMATLDSELGLCYNFLKLDERNFHCWNYRRFIVAAKAVILASRDNVDVDGSWSAAAGMLLDENELIMGTQITAAKERKEAEVPSKMNNDAETKEKIRDLLQSEWDFSQTKIEENFSNCSAFHYRSKLLPLFFFSVKSDENNNLIQDELELVQNAIFTEPDDQTAWWYHRFLLDFASKHLPSKDDEFQNTILVNEHELLSELVEEANGHCKWGLLALHLICVYQLKAIPQHDEGSIAQKKEEINSYLDQLVQLDPDRKLRYATMKVE